MSEKLGPEGIKLLCKQLETLILYYVITREPIRDFERKFSNWAKDLRNVQTIEDLRKFIRDKFTNEINDRENRFKQEFLGLSQSDLNPLYRTKYILGCIEEYVRENCNLPRNGLRYYQALELEHILPQTPDQKSLEEAITVGQFSNEKEYSECVKRLGNLTLVEIAINRAVNQANKISQENWFDNKLIEYRKSNVLITKSIAGVENIGKNTAFNMFIKNNLHPFNIWNKKSIEDRQQLLYNLAKNIWKIEFYSVSD